MIFQRALRRELGGTAGAVFTTLLTITITIMLIKILGQAAGGKIASQDVVALIGFQALNYLPVILILTGFVSVLLVVTRSYQDSEMVVWFASGMSLTRWIRPVLAFGAPLVALTAALTFFLTPWANRQSAEYRERFEKREDISRISPGRFQESSSANRIFFVEGLTSDASKVSNVFVNLFENGRTSIVVAKEGAIDIDANGDRVLVLDKGRRYEGVPSQSDFRIMEFDQYGVVVARQSQAVSGDQSSRALPTSVLLAEPTRFNRAEILWRMAQPLMALGLMLLAIPLSFVNPRVGRSAGLIVALLLFVTYSNTISVFQASVVQERLSFAAAWWPVHVVVALMTLLMFLWRLNVNHAYHPASQWARFKRRIAGARTAKA